MTNFTELKLFARETESSDHHTNRTIGLAVGFGVGIPIILTIGILIWVTVRHNRKMREEDEIDKDIDFNGDVSFWAEDANAQENYKPYPPEHLPASGPFDSRTRSLRSSARGSARESLGGSTAYLANTSVASSVPDPGSSVSAPNQSSELGPRPYGSQILSDQQSSHHSDDAASTYVNQIHSSNHSFQHLFAPEISQSGGKEHFSKALNHIYGPSPAYPSSERLRAPSVASFRSSGSIPGTPIAGGPFATPPRNSNTSPQGQRFHFRRTSTGSATADEETPLPPMHHVPYDHKHLQQLREAPHPYANLVDAQSAASIHTAMSRINPDVPENSEALGPKSNPAARHTYHQEARDRTSTFEFQS